LKRHAFVNGIAFTCLSIRQSFVSPDKEVLRKEIVYTKKCIEPAAQMGIPVFPPLRLFTERSTPWSVY